MAEMKATMLPPNPGLFHGRWTGTSVTWLETGETLLKNRVLWASVDREAPGPETRVLVEVKHEELETFPPQTRVNVSVRTVPDTNPNPERK